jgi:cytochrome P450
MTTGTEPVTYNPFDPSFRADPYPSYRRLREEDPTHYSPLGFWVFTRFADCDAMLRDSRSSSDEQNSVLFQEFVAANGENPMEAFVDFRPFLVRDPPDHTRLRSLVSKAFTPRTVEGLRPRADQLVTELLDRVAPRAGMDIIEDLAYPLPVAIISEMIGVPAEDHAAFRGWSRALARGLDPDFILPPEALAAREEALGEFREYFRSLMAKRRDDPQPDLLSALIAVEEDGARLNEEELLGTLVLLLVAGHETTVNLIGNGCLALLRHPDQMGLLRADPGIIRAAVEELLRFDSPVQMTLRIALEDMEIGGVTVERGQAATVLLGAANRDPAVFADPDRLDLRRPDCRPLSFGFGIHHCLGAPLARLEASTALAQLVGRFPQLELAVDEPARTDQLVLRGLSSLPVTI